MSQIIGHIYVYALNLLSIALILGSSFFLVSGNSVSYSQGLVFAYTILAVPFYIFTLFDRNNDHQNKYTILTLGYLSNATMLISLSRYFIGPMVLVYIVSSANAYQSIQKSPNSRGSYEPIPQTEDPENN
jgi:hypothetical protein